MEAYPDGRLPNIAELVKSRQPSSILEVGFGHGPLNEIARCRPGSIEGLAISGIEKTAAFIPAFLRSRFRELFEGDPTKILEELGQYDMVVIGEEVWRWGREKALETYRLCMEHCNDVAVAFVAPDSSGSGLGYGAPWAMKELLPASFVSFFLSGPGNCYCVFCASKKDYLDIRLGKLADKALGMIGAPSGSSLVRRYNLSEPSLNKIDLSVLAKHVTIPDDLKYFLDRQCLEHYRLIAHLSTLFENEIIFDIGTNKGYSALALAYNPTNKVVSYDIVDCRAVACMEELGRVEFCIGDVRQDPRLSQTPLVMLDTDHDGGFERQFYRYLQRIGYKGLLFLDDIHFSPQMKEFWNSISEPKVDLTFLGHWSGSGLVDFGSGPLRHFRP